ncbi:MAG TPA: DUF5666 domain-containing protein [Candidatus Paceibacterota bacterium]|nr:DUF5666 domain-containing protein [Candidatus Paceibacterota bacterium]
MKKFNLVLPLAGLMLAGSAVTGAAVLANAAGTTGMTAPTESQAAAHPKPVAAGKVTAINGTTLTIVSQKAGAAGTTYTVDAANATVSKRAKPATAGTAPTETAVALSTIAIGDRVAVQGTRSGTTITATAIETGGMFGGHGSFGHGVHGTVSAVNGTTLMVTGQNGTSYSVDASGATASKRQTMSLSDITVGDTVNVDGTVTGNSITAKQILDGVPLGKPAQGTQP